MKIPEEIIGLAMDISQGRDEISNRVDGVYVGDKERLINKLLFHARCRYVLVNSFPPALPRELNKVLELLPLVTRYRDAGFLFDLERGGRKEVSVFILSMETTDSIYIFSHTLDCLFYADDDLEDVTISLSVIG